MARPTRREDPDLEKFLSLSFLTIIPPIFSPTYTFQEEEGAEWKEESSETKGRGRGIRPRKGKGISEPLFIEEATTVYEATFEVGGQIQRFSASNPRSGNKIKL